MLLPSDKDRWLVLSSACCHPAEGAAGKHIACAPPLSVPDGSLRHGGSLGSSGSDRLLSAFSSSGCACAMTGHHDNTCEQVLLTCECKSLNN